MRLRSIIVVFALLSVSNSRAGDAPSRQQLEKFKSLPGLEKVAAVFNERFHGRSLFFWKRSSEVWRTQADAIFSFEQDILVASVDPGINHALVTEIEGPNIERSRYAVFLLCLRARFVPHSEFMVKEINGYFPPGDLQGGRISPFPPDVDVLGQEARRALTDTLNTPNAKPRNSAKIYTFALLQDLASVPTTDLAQRWRAASVKVPACLHDRSTAYSDDEQVIPILRAALASRGLEAAVAISSLLQRESNPETLNEEIEMLRFLDSAAVRLRRSDEGMRVIQAVKDAVLSHTLRYCGMRYNTTKNERLHEWLSLEKQFLRDRFPCDLSSWAMLISRAMEQQYGDQIGCGKEMQVFLSRLTEYDPTFPAWEFPSTGTQDDMMHTRFESKIRRYHEMWARWRQ